MSQSSIERGGTWRGPQPGPVAPEGLVLFPDLASKARPPTPVWLTCFPVTFCMWLQISKARSASTLQKGLMSSVKSSFRLDCKQDAVACQWFCFFNCWVNWIHRSCDNTKHHGPCSFNMTPVSTHDWIILSVVESISHSTIYAVFDKVGLTDHSPHKGIFFWNQKQNYLWYINTYVHLQWRVLRVWCSVKKKCPNNLMNNNSTVSIKI